MSELLRYNPSEQAALQKKEILDVASLTFEQTQSLVVKIVQELGTLNEELNIAQEARQAAGPAKPKYSPGIRGVVEKMYAPIVIPAIEAQHIRRQELKDFGNIGVEITQSIAKKRDVLAKALSARPEEERVRLLNSVNYLLAERGLPAVSA